MNIEEFYARCARLLNTEHEFTDLPYVSKRPRYDGTIRNTHAGRYNHRDPGNGRFPHHGLIRHFGDCIHVSLYNPHLSGIYPNPEAVLEALMRVLGVQETHTDAEIREHLDRAMEINAEAQRTIRAVGIEVADPRHVAARTKRTTIIDFYKLTFSSKQSIVESMSNWVPIVTTVSDFEYFKAFVLLVNEQDRMKELSLATEIMLSQELAARQERDNGF